VDVDFGTTTAALKPTDERIKVLADHRRSGPGGAVLPIRPLPADRLLAARRSGRQPAGRLERQDLAPWGSKYTININTEMNYWPAEPTGLANASSRWSRWSATFR
jgi:alpha-L-fucosidase 2